VYGFAAGDPVSYSDPFGLTPCSDRRAKLTEKFRKFMKDWRRYQKFDVTKTTNARHYEELANFQRGLRNDIEEYDNAKCKDKNDNDPDGGHAQYTAQYEQIRLMMDAPIKPAYLPKAQSTMERWNGIVASPPAPLDAVSTFGPYNPAAVASAGGATALLLLVLELAPK
ncbi:MAG: hypothetical protein ACREOJ_07230, partial [Gemmatimonadaceae bacterium]